MIITDRSKTIKIVLESKISHTIYLYYKRNGTLSSGIASTYDSEKNTHTWTIPCSNFSLNDNITDFYTQISGDVNLWKLNEGITWLIDGEETDTKFTYTNSIKFATDGRHTVQAVYKGNDAINMASTPLKSYKIGGQYKLQFVNENLNLSYKDRQRVNFKLTNSGVPVQHGIVYMVRGLPYATDEPIPTVSTGIAGYVNDTMYAGAVTLGAFYVVDGNVVAQTYKNFFIHKSDPYIEEEGDLTVNKNDYIIINFREVYSNGDPIKGEKVTVYINGAKFTRVINDNGKIGFKATQKGTFKFQVAYRGNDNLNAKTYTFTKKVV